MTLGVLGGTFDPIHNGHLAAAAAAQQSLELDSIVLVPSRMPPHREDPVGASAEQRYDMAALAAAERPGWSASRIEIDREGASYTFDTLAELRRGVSQGYADLLHPRGGCVRGNCHMVALSGRAGPG